MPSHFRGPILGSLRSAFYGTEGLLEGFPVEAVADSSLWSFYSGFNRVDDYSTSLFTETTVGTTASASVSVQTGANTGLIGGESALQVNPGTANSTGYGSIQGTGIAPASIATDKKARFVARLRLTSVSGVTAMVGLAQSDTTLLASDGSNAAGNGLVFRISGGNIFAEVSSGGSVGSSVDSGVDVADNGVVNLGIRVLGGKGVAFYVNGRMVSEVTTGLPAMSGVTPLLVSFAAVNTAGGTGDLNLNAIGFWSER